VRRRSSAVVLPVLAAIGLGIALFLLAEKLAGQIPPCGPVAGCATVDASPYSQVGGVPVALFGVAYSAVIFVGGLGWWWAGDRRSLLVTYGLGLVGVLVEAYLVYLQVAVIDAVCAWCAAYGATVVLGWLAAALALRGAPSGP
jgi:uncharacterized membrane protein